MALAGPLDVSGSASATHLVFSFFFLQLYANFLVFDPPQHTCKLIEDAQNSYNLALFISESRPFGLILFSFGLSYHFFSISDLANSKIGGGLFLSSQAPSGPQ